MSAPLPSETRFCSCEPLSQDKNNLKNVIKNTENKSSIPTFVDNKAFENYNTFYNNNNYIYPDEFKQPTEDC